MNFIISYKFKAYIICMVFFNLKVIDFKRSLKYLLLYLFNNI